ncbi:hypothetical protein DSO57_1007863 [Entomophthora muscae]|uniref:Uncharacterized protein n=1 Tax=Entomophthora muscae TaxID=34485 RepID=A0ACC2TU62_9FUNG|nr:hypothetical protein DSO57_1007863 [Entomophthora muscae]
MSLFFANFGFDLESFPTTVLESMYPQADKLANQMKKIHLDLILFLTKACKEYKKYTNCHCSPEKDYVVASYVYLNARNLKLKIPSKKLGPKKIGPPKVL